MSNLAWMRPRLAELIGLKTGADWSGYYEGDINGLWHQFPPGAFCPDQDVNQAIWCVEAATTRDFDVFEIRKIRIGTYWVATLRNEKTHQGASWNRSGKSPAEAICLVIAAAKGWTEPEG